MLTFILDFFSNYLIECMAFLLCTGLVFRWASYRSSLKEDQYFTTFTSEIEKQIFQFKEGNDNIDDIELYLGRILDEVAQKLPTRTIRATAVPTRPMAKKMGAKNVVSLRDFVRSEQGLLHSIKSESAVFKSKFPPNYHELTSRILDKDDNWNRLLGIFPIAPISRLNDVLPGLFVVFGIFGTFIGIAMALPEIAKIDFNNLESSGGILTNFVLSVTFAMKTSIAGIMFSLIMTLLNTLAPVRAQRQRTFKKLANCFETMWISIHGKKGFEQNINNYLPKIFELMKKWEAEHKKNLNEEAS